MTRVLDLTILLCDAVKLTSYNLGLKWQLASNSVVFMARPSVVSFLMEDELVPYVHYIPVKVSYYYCNFLGLCLHPHISCTNEANIHMCLQLFDQRMIFLM